MNKTIIVILVFFCMFFVPLSFAGGGGGGGGGSSVPDLHILGQLIFVISIALWYRKSK
ncbi:MAG: hypothetical protein ACI9YH_003805 [Colwellia sp.]|jgi:hypothetical protein